MARARPVPRSPVRRRKRSPPPARARGTSLSVAERRELDALRARLAAQDARPRWNADPGDVQRSVSRLVLTLVEFVRQLLERQAIRRLEAGSLGNAEAEAVGRALMELEDTVGELARRFGLAPEDLNLELGPLGRML
jgi:hypothetical protein